MKTNKDSWLDAEKKAEPAPRELEEKSQKYLDEYLPPIFLARATLAKVRGEG